MMRTPLPPVSPGLCAYAVPNPPSDLCIDNDIRWFRGIPDHQQGIRCKAPRSDD